MAQLNFDATNVAPSVGPAMLIPPGVYNAQMVASEMKPNSAGTGNLLVFTFQITDGQFQGATVTERVNWTNPSAQAVEIARRTVSAIGHACDIVQIIDTQQLHGIPIQIRIGIEKGTSKGDGTSWPDKSKIFDFMAAGTMQPAMQEELEPHPAPAAQALPPQAQALPPQAQAAAPQAASSTRPPWAS